MAATDADHPRGLTEEPPRTSLRQTHDGRCAMRDPCVVDDPPPLDQQLLPYATCIRVDGKDRRDPHAGPPGRMTT
jgi:hypothetical protein